MFSRFFRLAMITAVSLLVMGGCSNHWSYHGKTGPDHWASLNPDYKDCGEGTRQSPIDIPSDAPVDESLPALAFDYASSVLLTLTNDGHTVKITMPADSGTLSIGTDAFPLDSIHFHAASEHLLDGQSFAVEMHLVHAKADGSLAVIGVFLNIDRESEALAPIFSNLPAHKGGQTTVANFDLNGLLPTDWSTFRYSGSLTTPDCREEVRWHVMQETTAISQDQANAFTSLFSGHLFPDGNRRPVQALNGRVVNLVPAKTE